MYYKRKRCGELELMVTGIVSYGICLSLGACIGFLGAVFAPLHLIKAGVD